MTVRYRPRLFLITFDLPGARPGDPRYRDVDKCLARNGTVFKPMKQVRLLVTDQSPQRISRQIRSRIGPDGNASVLRVGRYSVIDCVDPGVQLSVRRLIARHGR